jgi:ElaA protein
MTGAIRSAAFADLDAATLYRLLKLRGDVFVVEQRCAYPDLDGRDAEPRAVHLWWERDGEVEGCLRVLREPGGGSRIGRVAVAPPARGRGIAASLVRHALSFAEPPVIADAQAHLAAWYARLGFAVAGEEFVEDGIPHVPMVWGGGRAGVGARGSRL